MNHNCQTQILQNLGDAKRKSSYATPQFGPLFCDNSLIADIFFFEGGGGKGEKQEQASCFRAVWLINCNIRDEIYVLNI